VLRCVAACCNIYIHALKIWAIKGVLLRVAACCNMCIHALKMWAIKGVLRCGAVWCSVWRHGVVQRVATFVYMRSNCGLLTVCCSVVQCVAACCSVLRCVAMSCSVVRVLHCAAVCCGVLQFAKEPTALSIVRNTLVFQR